MQLSTVQDPHKNSSLPDYSNFVRKNEPNPFEPKQQDYFANFLTENKEMAKGDIVSRAQGMLNERPVNTALNSASPNANPFDAQNKIANANMNNGMAMQQLSQMNSSLLASNPMNMQATQAMPNMQINSHAQAQAKAQMEAQMDANAQFMHGDAPRHRGALYLSGSQRAEIQWTTTPNAMPLESKSGIALEKETLKALHPSAMPLDQSSLSILSRASKRKEENVLTGASLKIDGIKEPKEAFSGKNGALNVFDEQDVKNKNASSSIGELSARYESGNSGINAVAYDRVGGTSYGKFQIASKPGTFDDFVRYLSKEAPDIAEQLKKGGPANTGSRNGRMPEVWKSIAEEQPHRFELLQENFIKKTHFDPAFASLQNSGLDTECPVLKEVVWSTAVQHGATGARRIFNRALNGVDTNNMESFINNVYDVRTSQFRSSTTGVQSAIEVRLAEEKTTALNMLT